MNCRTTGCFILTLAVAGLLGTLSARGAEVYAAKITIKGIVPDQINGVPAITKVNVSGNNLLNVAMGRDRTAPIPKGQVLALIVDCDRGTASLAVFDTGAGVSQALIATNSSRDFFEGATSGQFIMRMELLATGSETNRITGGYLIVAGSYSRDAQGCPSNVKATMVGLIETVVTDDIGTHGLPFLFSKGTLATGKTAVGTVP